MRLLLDTHIALWAIDDPSRLGRHALRRIETAETVSVSAVSLWEIAIKHALGPKRRDAIRISGREAQSRFLSAGFALLSVTGDHAAAVDTLPALHDDPFDRLLVAQALTEPMHFLTRDARLADYGALILQA